MLVPLPRRAAPCSLTWWLKACSVVLPLPGAAEIRPMFITSGTGSHIHQHHQQGQFGAYKANQGI